MRIGAYRFDCQLTTPAVVPAYKGSMLRGAFGHAFKKISCALRRQECDSCLLTDTCPYSVIFENHATGAPPLDAPRTRISSRPHPYILQPPLSGQRAYGKGDRFSFGLSLFGKANEFLPHIIYAVEMMGEAGLGRKNGEERGQFLLEGISCDGASIYDGHAKVLSRGLALPEVTLEPCSTPVTTLEVAFLTPLRLKHQNELQGALPFHLLIRAALRRIATLEEYHGNGEPALDYRGLARRAEAVRTETSDCHWLELERYSARQKTAMLLGGLTGTIRYQGDLGEFLPLLRYCEQTHLGKQTTFGLGQIALTPGNPS